MTSDQFFAELRSKCGHQQWKISAEGMIRNSECQCPIEALAVQKGIGTSSLTDKIRFLGLEDLAFNIVKSADLYPVSLANYKIRAKIMWALNITSEEKIF